MKQWIKQFLRDAFWLTGSRQQTTARLDLDPHSYIGDEMRTKLRAGYAEIIWRHHPACPKRVNGQAEECFCGQPTRAEMDAIGRIAKMALVPRPTAWPKDPDL